MQNFVGKTKCIAGYMKVANAGGQFLEGPEKFSHPESRSKISKLMIAELFYSRVLNINIGFLHTRRFRRIHFSVFRYR